MGKIYHLHKPTGNNNWLQWVAWIALILAVVAIILVLIGSGTSHSRHNSIAAHGITLILQKGVTSGSTDTMVTGGNNLYIGQSSEALSLTISANEANKEGREIFIKNNSAQNMTLKGGTGVTLQDGRLNLTVTPGQTAFFVGIGGNAFLRLQ